MKGASCAVMALGLAAGAAHAADAGEGRKLAELHCGRCHAVGEEGASPMREAPAFRDLHRRYPIDDLAEALAEGISTGHPAMPEYTFTPEQIEALLGYMKSLK